MNCGLSKQLAEEKRQFESECEAVVLKKHCEKMQDLESREQAYEERRKAVDDDADSARKMRQEVSHLKNEIDATKADLERREAELKATAASFEQNLKTQYEQRTDGKMQELSAKIALLEKEHTERAEVERQEYKERLKKLEEDYGERQKDLVRRAERQKAEGEVSLSQLRAKLAEDNRTNLATEGSRHVADESA